MEKATPRPAGDKKQVSIGEGKVPIRDSHSAAIARVREPCARCCRYLHSTTPIARKDTTANVTDLRREGSTRTASPDKSEDVAAHGAKSVWSTQAPPIGRACRLVTLETTQRMLFNAFW